MSQKYYPAKVYRWVNMPLYLIKEMLINRRNNEKDNMILITGARGDGKAMALNSKVLTPNGWKKIIDLKVGDEIFSGNGIITRVTHLHPISKMNLYKVETRDGRGKDALFNEEHLFNVINKQRWKSGKAKTIPLKEIIKKYSSPTFDKRNGNNYIEYLYQIPNPKPLEYSEKKLEIDPYILGIWLGDGHSLGGRITTNDKEIFNYFNYEVRKHKSKFNYQVIGLIKDLRKYNLIGNKHIPDVFLKGSIKQRIALLQGLLDSDGFISKRGNEIEFSNKKEILIDSVVKLVLELGGNIHKEKRITKCLGKPFESFRLKITIPSIIIPSRLERKLKFWKDSHKNECLSNFITNIQYVKEDSGRCISVGEDGTFITDNYMVTHNSTFTGKILFQFEDFDPYKCMVYNKEKMFELVKEKNGYVWADEAVVNAAKGNVMSRTNKMLHELVTINRDNFNIVFFCMPFVEDFDSKILQYISMWIHIDSRGLGVMLLPSNKGIFGKKNWDILAMKKLFDEFQKENSGASHVPYWIYPNFRGYVKFGKLTKEQDAIMKEIKAVRKNENLEKQSQEEVITEVKQYDNYNKYSAKKLAEMIAKGEIRDIESFKFNCQEMKLDEKAMETKINSIFKKSNAGTTMKQLFKKYETADSLIKF